MAEIREIALAMAVILRTSADPEPLPVALKGESLADAALLVRTIIRECSDAGVSLHKIEMGSDLLRHLRDGHLPDESYLDVQLVSRADLASDLLLYRTSG